MPFLFFPSVEILAYLIKTNVFETTKDHMNITEAVQAVSVSLKRCAQTLVSLYYFINDMINPAGTVTVEFPFLIYRKEGILWAGTNSAVRESRSQTGDESSNSHSPGGWSWKLFGHFNSVTVTPPAVGKGSDATHKTAL